mgnify:CR=1 FL=1
MAREITLYSKERCVQCAASERELKKIGVNFEEDGPRIVLGETTYIHADATTDENREFALGLGHMQAPVMTVVVDGELADHWSGFVPDKIKEHAIEVLV